MTGKFLGKPKAPPFALTRVCLGCHKAFVAKQKGQYFHDKCRKVRDAGGIGDHHLNTPKVGPR